MAQIQRHRRAIAAALLGLVALGFAPALAQDQGSKDGTDLFDRPVLAIDPGMHTAAIQSLSVDSDGRFAVTGGSDRTVRVWSAGDGKLLRTIWIPIGPDPVGVVYAVAITPDGSTIAAGGFTERLSGGTAIYLFDRESGVMVRRVRSGLSGVVRFLAFSPDGRYLAATFDGKIGGLRVFDRNADWGVTFKDDAFEDASYGAAFAPDGRLATTSFGLNGTIRLYDSSFHLTNKLVQAPSALQPYHLAFSPDGRLLAIGHVRSKTVDLFDGYSLHHLRALSPDLNSGAAGLSEVAWSRDGRTLFSAGTALDNGQYFVISWDEAGLGEERRLTYCVQNTASGLGSLPAGRILVAAMHPCLSLIGGMGKAIWTAPSLLAGLCRQADALEVSRDGKVVDFEFCDGANTQLRFDVESLRLSSQPPIGDLTLPPNRIGLAVGNWQSDKFPMLAGRLLPIQKNDKSLSLAIAEDSSRLFLGSAFGVTSYDDLGKVKWTRKTRGEAWAVNASRDGRIVVAIQDDSTLRWRRADDGSELLALQVLPNKKDWVLWTPEGFYEATPGAENALKWVVNHGPDQAATTLPVSAIAKLHRPNALSHVLDQLETAHALGVDDISQARFDVQAATGSAKPPGGVLHVLAIGIDKFGDKAGSLHLDYAAEDAHEVAAALLDSQKGGTGKVSLYADIDLRQLRNDEANGAAILDHLDAMAKRMAENEEGQDVAVILVSSHGEMIDGQFYLIPYGFDAGSQGRSIKSAVSASEFAKKVGELAAHGKVLLLLDACHSGAVGAQAWAKDPDAKALQDAMDLENVTVLTSSRKDELSYELPEWKHGALAEAFLDALKGAQASGGIIRLSSLTEAMENEVQSLTKGKQHLGMHVNFSSDLFVAGHY